MNQGRRSSMYMVLDRSNEVSIRGTYSALLFCTKHPISTAWETIALKSEHHLACRTTATVNCIPVDQTNIVAAELKGPVIHEEKPAGY